MSTKQSGKAAQRRPIPQSFCYPVTPIDLEHDALLWLFDSWPPPQPELTAHSAALAKAQIASLPEGQQKSSPLKAKSKPLMEMVKEQIACSRAVGSEVWGVKKPRLTAAATLFLDERPALDNPLSRQPACQAARQRLLQAKKNREGILIYGDYDCDGVTSVTLMYEALLGMGMSADLVDFVIPDRLQDGYGLHASVVKRHLDSRKPRKADVSLVIAVDCGTAAKEAVAELLKSKKTVIVVDHHSPDPAHSLKPHKNLFHLNPKLWVGEPNWEPAFHMDKMCAAGLVYLLGSHLVSFGPAPLKTWDKNRALLLAGFATCVDIMELIGINRVLLKHSLRLANQEGSLALIPGLVNLKKRMGPHPKRGRPVTEETYGFYWGPCINAAGRIANVYDALNLLLTRDYDIAKELAGKCVEFNQWRKAIQIAMLDEALNIANKQIAKEKEKNKGKEMEPDPLSILVVSKESWHPGVVGIVASKLKEIFRRPIIVGSLLPYPCKEDPHRTIWRGSGRSIRGGCDFGTLFHDAAVKKKSAILSGGGHPMAGGLSFSDEQRKDIQANLVRISGFDLKSHVPWVEVAAPASAFSPGEWRTLFLDLRPFGNGNACPSLLVEAAELLSVRVRTSVAERWQDRSDQPALDDLEVTEPNEPEPTKEARSHYWSFIGSDIRELVPFIGRLQGGEDNISKYLQGQLDPVATAAIAGYKNYARDAERVSRALARSLDRIIRRPTFYDSERFERIQLRRDTSNILKMDPKGVGRVQLNRMLLEDAYPKELRRRPLQGVPHVFAYEGLFEDKITGKSFFAQWTELEQAEVLWQVHRFRLNDETGAPPPRLPKLFRLQLELREFIPGIERSNVYRGKFFRPECCFQIRQCVPIPRGPLQSLRMRVKTR